MPNPHNAKGQPVKLSFLDLFGASIPSRSDLKISRMERKKPKKEEPSPPIETSPESTAPTQAPTEPAATDPGPVEWTKLEELALLGMKAQDMSWKEINEALPGKDLEDIKKKYKAMCGDAPASVEPKDGDVKEGESKNEEEKDDKKEAKLDEAKDAEDGKKEPSEDDKPLKENKPWKKSQKGHKAQKGKGKAKEPKPENVDWAEAEPEKAKPEEIKGMMIAKATAAEKGKGGELKSIDGHPVIFVDDDEELDFNELLYLYGLNARYDELKWITVGSRFFDKFGKRVGPEKLKEKLAGVL